jgi:hypothetical protein
MLSFILAVRTKVVVESRNGVAKIEKYDKINVEQIQSCGLPSVGASIISEFQGNVAKFNHVKRAENGIL